MNHSFRTAFWAMCLGLTVPMLLFVGAELVSGKPRAPLLAGRDRTNVARDGHASETEGAAGNTGSSFRGSMTRESHQSEIGAGITESAKKSAQSGNRAGTTSSPGGIAARAPAELETIEPEAGEFVAPSVNSLDVVAAPTGGVRLGPQLEPDNGVPGMSVALQSQKPDRGTTGLLPKAAGETMVSRDSSNAQIEARLTRIQQHLDQLTHTLLMQTQQKQQEQLQQATQLLQQVQQSGRLHELEKQLQQLQEMTDTLNNPTRYDPKSAPAKPQRKTTTRVHYLRHAIPEELLPHVIPLLTPAVGRAHAAGTTETTNAGSGAVNPPRVIVSDYPEVQSQVDQIVRDLDVPAADITLDARVFAITLVADMPQGLDFSRMKDNGHAWIMNSADAGAARVKLGVLHGTADEFVSYLERIAAVRTVATPRAVVPERQPADLIIGTPTRSTNPPPADRRHPSPAETSARLTIRPSRAPGGAVRLEITSKRQAGLSEPVPLPGTESGRAGRLVLRRGQTAIVAGMTEPFFGADKTAADNASTRPERTEYVVLLTPQAPRTSGSVGAIGMRSPDAPTALRSGPQFGAPAGERSAEPVQDLPEPDGNRAETPPLPAVLDIIPPPGPAR